MKKFLFIFAVFACIVPSLGYAAVNVKVKKAAPVATKKADTMESATSLLPAVLNLVSSVKALNMQQQQLSADCAPTSDEINTVNNLVKEWAKIGDTSAQSACYGLGQFVCNGGYSAHVRDFDEGEACYETFEDLADRDTIWQGFPKVSSAQKCDVDGKKCHTVSNIYDIFAKIPFSDDDYTQAEAKKVGALKEKANRCAPAKIKAAKRELYGGFLVQTLNSVGQTTAASGTSSIIEAVSSMGGSGDLKSMLPSLGQMALQGFDK
jgi:hypothetical protein